MNDQTQALCFMAGANSIFYGERLLTTDNPEADHDRELFRRLGIHPMELNAGDYSDEAAEDALQRQIAEQEAEEQGLFYDAHEQTRPETRARQARLRLRAGRFHGCNLCFRS